MNTNGIERIVKILVIVCVALALIGASTGTIDFVAQIFVSLISGAVLSVIAGYLVEALTGNLLKVPLLVIKVGGVDVSVTAFFVATTLLKLIVFK